MKQDSLERSQSDLKKLRRKSQGKNALKYESKENEVRKFKKSCHISSLSNRGNCFSCVYEGRTVIRLCLWNPRIHPRAQPYLQMLVHVRARTLIWLVNVSDSAAVNNEFNYQRSSNAKWLQLFFLRSTKCHANWKSSAISKRRGSSTKSKCFSVSVST